jgi:hypothetical protein
MIPVLILAFPWVQGGTRDNAILEGVAVQAGDQLVTLGDLQRVLKRYREFRPPANPEEDDRQRAQALRDLWTLRLESQAGEDLGLDPAQIERINRLNLAADRERAGLEAYLAQLGEEGRDALADEEDRERELLRYMWEYSVLGNAFAGRRARSDNTIRPGELRAIYAENRDRLAPATVQLRWLIVASSAAGGPEAARASCEDARARALAGEDLALLVEERGSEFRETRGLTPFAPPQAILEPTLAEFAETAEVLDLSPVLPLTNRRTGKPDPELGYHFAELHERRTPPVPEFGSVEVQRSLREFFARQRRERVLERERERLRRSSFSWVNPLLLGPERSAAPLPGP